MVCGSRRGRCATFVLEPLRRGHAVDVLPSEPYVIKGRYPSPETVGRTYDEADLIRAVSMHRFFRADHLSS
jgi:hypothetical protein